MKPKIDLEHSITKLAINLHQQQVEKALDANQTVESAVIPIYSIPKRKGHQNPKSKPEQIGSGVIVRLKDQFFIFTATHVLLEFNEQALLTGDGNGTLIQEFVGERISAGKPEVPLKNIYDASVFHIQSTISNSLKDVAITTEDFDFENPDEVKPIYMAAGYRSKISNTSGSSIKSKRECFPSIEYNKEDYDSLKVDSRAQIALAFENQILVNGKWQTSPSPKGFSGGAIIKVSGTSLKNEIPEIDTQKQLLTAITIEHHRDRNNKLGYLLGTRINVHLGLVNKFYPDLLSDLIQNQS